MSKQELTTKLWSAYNSDEVEEKQASVQDAIVYLIGQDGFESLCDAEAKKDMADAEGDADPNMVSALIRAATN